jgi:hypothetical protein
MRFMIRFLPALFIVAVGCNSGCRSSSPAPQPSTASPDAVSETVLFRGMCDASGAVALGGTRFAVADDEDNVLRVYDSARGGDPLYAVDLSPALGLPGPHAPEADIEAATRLADRALWLTSHGRDKHGELQPSRLRFFATTAPAEGKNLTPIGSAYHGLLQDMLDTPALAQLGLADASLRPPKHGGLNIEGMARRTDDRSILIGFRNPRPNNKALLVPLLNPLALLEGAHAQFGEPQLLDLGGLGVRSIALWRGRYLVIGGAMDKEASSRLYVWDGADHVQQVIQARLEEFSPEAFVAREDSDRVMLLSDDGTREIDGRPCKKLKYRQRKQFRGLWIRVPG